MASLITGYNYDIFISYRQKDNRGGRQGVPPYGTTQSREAGWVSEFVEALKTELESTLKEDVSIYYDENPHDGLLETHDVDASLKEKLKCLIFIPVISRTYCDPRAFAWQHEFLAFIGQASADNIGLKVTLPNGNVATRVLPIRIHELGAEDTMLCETALGSVLRGVDFIYKAPGVNRPLRQEEDHPKDNLNKTYYRDQINKVANAIDEIITGLKNGRHISVEKHPDDRNNKIRERRIFGKIKYSFHLQNYKRKLIAALIASVCLASVLIIYRSVYLNKTENTFTFLRLTNLNNDSSLVNDAANFIESINEKIYLIKGITVRPVFRDQFKDLTEPLNVIRKKVKSNYILDGNIRKDGQNIKIYIELTASRKNRIALTKPIIYERIRSSQIAVETVKDIAKEMGVPISLDEERLITTEFSANPEVNFSYTSANKNLKDAWYFYNYGDKIHDSASFITTIESYDKIIKNDTTSALAYAKRAIARSFGFYLEQLDSSNIEKCKLDIDKALSLDKDLAEIDIAQGLFNYYCLQKNEKAFDFFKQASEKDPYNYRPFFYMALASRRMGNWDDCRKLIRQVIKFDPQEALFLTNIGMIYTFFHEYDSAIIFQDKSIDLIPGWAAAYKNKFETLILKNGLTSESRSLVDEAIEKTGDKMTKYRILIKIYDKKYSEAFALAEKADPEDFEIPAEKYLYSAMISRSLNNMVNANKYYKLAKSDLIKELEKKPDGITLHGMLGLAYAGLQDKIKAIKEVERAIQIAYQKNRMDESDMKVCLAQVKTMLGDYDDAFPDILFSLNNPSFLSKKLLLADPVWKPILDNREYRKKLR